MRGRRRLPGRTGRRTAATVIALAGAALCAAAVDGRLRDAGPVAPRERAAGAPAPAAPRGALDLLRAYLRIDTSNPPGRERAGALLLKEALERGGVPAELYEPAPGRTSVYARLRGTSREPGLLLHHHVDVVPADPAGWEAPPFAAQVVRGNVLVGRGAVDCKGLGIAMLEAFLAVKAAGPPRRDVVFLATADEETGGPLGVEAIRKDRPAWLAGIGEAIGEGGDVETIVDRARWFGVEVQQKGALWLRLEASGAGGHGASADASEPAVRIARAVAAVGALRQAPRVEPVVAAEMAALSRLRPSPLRELLADLPAALARDPAAALGGLTPWQRLAVTDSVEVTRLGTDSPVVNARPRTAWAELDARLLPSTDPRAFLGRVRSAISDPKVRVTELLSASGDAASPQSGLFDVIRAALERRYPGARVGPVLGLGLSENRRLRAMGIRTYGLTPFRLNYYDAAGIHGVNERLRTDWFEDGVETLGAIVREAAGTRGAAAP